jgi:transposase-like protein
MPTGSYAYRAVDVATGDTIEGTVRNMRHAAEDQARRLGYEVVDSV